MAVIHAKVSAIADGADTSVVRPSDWNASHTIEAGTITDVHVAAANKDGTAVTASLRTLGTTAAAACAGNDARLSDARTPVAHNHSGADLTSGTIPDARMPALTGEVTSAVGTVALTIAAGAVVTAKILDANITYAKIQNVSVTDRLLGRFSIGAGPAEEIACTAAGRALIDDATAADQRTTLGLVAVASSGSAADLGAGTLPAARMPALTGDVTTGAGAVATTIAALAVTDAKVATANKDGTNTTPSLRTLGTGAAQAAAGNDARLSDARAPTAHAASHKGGGADPIKLDELAAPTDITTLNASTTAHGLLAKLSGVAGQYPDGLLGAWTTLPAGGASGALALNQHILAANFTITAGYSASVSRYLEIGDTFTLEIGDDADLELT